MPDPDWTVRAADTVDAVVGVVRDKAVVPITTAARWAVYGILAAIVGTAAAVLVVAGLVRAIDVYTGAGNVWIAYAIVGGIFVVAGLFLWSKRTPRA